MPSLLTDADCWFFFFRSHPWKKKLIFFSMMSGQWQRLLAVIYGIWQGGLCKPDGWSGKPDDCSRSMREMPRRMQNLSRGSVVHPYYYHNHNIWPQIYGKLRRDTDGQGNLVECTTNIPIHFTMLHRTCNNFFICRIMANVLNISKQSAYAKLYAEPCRKMQNASTTLAEYHRLPQGCSRLLFP